MKTTYNETKSLKEVWEWKEQLSEEVKDMDTASALAYLIEKSAKTVERLGLVKEQSLKKKIVPAEETGIKIP